MRYEIRPSTQFKKDVKLAKRRGYDLNKLIAVIDRFAMGMPLEEQFRDHELKGSYGGFRECHIQPDWLLVYKYVNSELILFLSRTGTHIDLL